MPRCPPATGAGRLSRELIDSIAVDRVGAASDVHLMAAVAHRGTGFRRDYRRQGNGPKKLVS